MLIFSMYKGSDSLSRMFDLLPGTLGSAVPLFPGSSWIFPGAKRARSFFFASFKLQGLSAPSADQTRSCFQVCCFQTEWLHIGSSLMLVGLWVSIACQTQSTDRDLCTLLPVQQTETFQSLVCYRGSGSFAFCRCNFCGERHTICNPLSFKEGHEIARMI